MPLHRRVIWSYEQPVSPVRWRRPRWFPRAHARRLLPLAGDKDALGYLARVSQLLHEHHLLSHRLHQLHIEPDDAQRVIGELLVQHVQVEVHAGREPPGNRHHFSDTALNTPSSGTSVHSRYGLYSFIPPAIRGVFSPK